MHTESKIVPITTFNQIEGKWQGLSKRMPDMRDHAQVVVTINERGHFNFISDRGDGLLLGTGTPTILNGQAMGTTSSGPAPLRSMIRVAMLYWCSKPRSMMAIIIFLK